MGNEAPIRHARNDTDHEQNEVKIDLEGELSTLLELLSELQKIRMNKDAETMTSNKINMKTDFKIFVGIDFGTNGCGIAYAIHDDILSKTNENDDDTTDDSSDDDNKDDNKKNNKADIISDGYSIIPHQWSDLAHDNSKLNTCILLNDENELQMVGNLARITFTEMQKKDWKLFDNFKMSLYKKDDEDDDEEEEGKENDEDDEKDDGIRLKHKIRSYDGSITKSDIVFCATLKYLKENALKYIEERIGIKDVGIDDIQWILTIPALWNNESKHMMRQWGLASGLINKDITNHLKIVLEPECASLEIQHEYQYNKNIQFNKNDKYLLVDAGGGTVDIVVHEIYSEFGVKEIIASFGGPYGSINIDHKFSELFDILFKKENMDKFKKNRAKEYVKWIENVVASKRTFYDNGEQNTYHSIELDMTFYNEIKNEKFENKKLSKYIKCIDQIFGVNASDIGIGVNDGKESMFKISKSGIDYVYLNIHKELWKKIFDDNCLNDIINKIKSIMTENDILNDIKYIFMVGGLSQCKYFQKRTKDEFKSIAIVIPQNPLLSVVCGAARYGYKTDFVHTRILKKTYAVRITATYKTLMIDHQMRDLVNYIENDDDKNEEDEALISKLIEIYKDDANEEDFKDETSDKELRTLLCDKVIKPQLDQVPISKEWIESNITYSAIAKELVCNRLLSILARKGDEIEINCKDKITKTYKRWSKDQAISSIEIYSSNNKDPRTIDEATKLCEGQLIYPKMDDNDDDTLDVIFELSFDDSLLIAYVYPKGKPNERAEVVMEYQTN